MLILSRQEIARMATFSEYLEAVENAFRDWGEGRASPPGVLHIGAAGGAFHIKAARLGDYLAAKVNGNFPGRTPTIQGAILLSDAASGRPLALLDSIEITLQRTAAASALAARYLARRDSRELLICGCGAQGEVQLRAMAHVLPIERALAYDIDQTKAREFARRMSAELSIKVEHSPGLPEGADVIVTATTARWPFLKRAAPGTFIAAVGADNHDKQELEAELVCQSKLVVDVEAQCAESGELHHAPGARVHAELAEIVCGRKPGRESDREIIVFDSTGTALQDVAASAAIYRRALDRGVGLECSLA